VPANDLPRANRLPSRHHRSPFRTAVKFNTKSWKITYIKINLIEQFIFQTKEINKIIKI
jgi:hypothetical protein